jgi:hypothetical protein
MKHTNKFKKRSNIKNNIQINLKKNNNISTKKILPLRFFKYVRKYFRKYFFKKKISIIFNIHYNYIISYKGKNPRMGKGTGFFVRNAYQLNLAQPIFFKKNISLLRANFLKNLLKKKFNILIL